MTDQSRVPAQLPSLREVVDDYLDRRAQIPAVCKDYEEMHKRVDLTVTMGGAYVGRSYNYHPSLSERTLDENLLKSAWRYVYNGLNIKQIASASDRKRLDMVLEKSKPFTIENIREEFGQYLVDPRFHILKGLAECFIDLDPAYKSHSKVKVGVQGLPKRIIIERVCDSYGIEGWGGQRLRDVLNAMNVYHGDPHMEHREFRTLIDTARKEGSATYKGMTLKLFKNNNGHLIFPHHKLVMINEALAEFYGDVLPDTPEAAPKKRTGTAVSKDLQFYPTPDEVIERIMHDVRLETGQKVLEPSCGDGRILDWLRAKQSGLNLFGVEVDAGRVEQTRAKGHTVYHSNFLATTPIPDFDLVVMNPPFYGLHWQKHLEHAQRFLRPPPEGKRWGGGQLICILPATAFYDGHLGKMGLVKADAHEKDRGWLDSGWRDLPVASFAASGTNVPTGYITVTRRE